MCCGPLACAEPCAGLCRTRRGSERGAGPATSTCTASPRPHVPSPISSARFGAERSSSEGLRAWPGRGRGAAGCSAARGQRAAAPGLCRAALRLREPPASLHPCVPASLRPRVPCVPCVPCPRAGQQTLNQATHLGGNPRSLPVLQGGHVPAGTPPGHPQGPRLCPDLAVPAGTPWLCQLCPVPHGDIAAVPAVPCTPWGRHGPALHPVAMPWPRHLCPAPHGDLVAMPAMPWTPWGCPGCASHVPCPLGTNRLYLAPHGDAVALPAMPCARCPTGMTQLCQPPQRGACRTARGARGYE